MTRLRPIKKEKFKLKEKPDQQSDNDRIAFSFAHIGTNKAFQFDHFKKNLRDEMEARRFFWQLLKDLSCLTWKQVFEKRREEYCGTEEIPVDRFSLKPSQDFDCERKINFNSFRFGPPPGMPYRMIGYRAKRSNIFYVIGFDWDYSAYDHGG